MNSRKLFSETRKTFPDTKAHCQQPSRILIVDVTSASWDNTCSVLSEALENTLSLACRLTGPCRVPLLSLYVVQNQQECLLPFVVGVKLCLLGCSKHECNMLLQFSKGSYDFLQIYIKKNNHSQRAKPVRLHGRSEFYKRMVFKRRRFMFLICEVAHVHKLGFVLFLSVPSVALSHMLLPALSVLLHTYQSQLYNCNNLDGETACIPVDYTNITTLGAVPDL